MSPEEIEAIARRVVELLNQQKSSSAIRQKRYRERRNALRNTVTVVEEKALRYPLRNGVTHNAISSGNVTALHNGNGNGSSPLSPPQTPPLTPPTPKKKVYVTHEMVVERCKKLKFSDMIDFAWGKVRTGSYYGTPIENEDDFRGVMAEILEKWKSC